jgi:AraC-like DNA-binding protein
MVRIGATIGVPEVLRDLGFNPTAVLNELGVDPVLFENPNNQVSFNARGRLLLQCAERTGCPHFGLLVGQRAGLHSFGLVGLLVKYSPDVEYALDSLTSFMHLHVRGATTSLLLDSGSAYLEYQIYQARSIGNEQVGDGAVAVAFNILSELCGSKWKPIEVRFAHRKPEDVAPYRRFFQAPLVWNTGHYAVAFSAKWLSHSLQGSSPELLKLLQQEVDKLDLLQEKDFLEQVRGLLRSAIVTGHSSADQVAELLSMSRRTMNRHLSAEGTNFKRVADEIRFVTAQQFLENTAMEISHIAEVLGYSNASAFTRAFHRWSGTTPANWRMTHASLSSVAGARK